jgi:hypothetical protein
MQVKERYSHCMNEKMMSDKFNDVILFFARQQHDLAIDE